jgi:hypothetical protein
MALQRKINEHALNDRSAIAQRIATDKKNEIFRSVVPEDKLHPYFVSLRDDIGHSPAKGIIKEIAYAFADLDGNFIEQFQSSGFNSRLWELYMFAYLHEEQFALGEGTAYPDFMCVKSVHPIFIECTTVNPSASLDIDWIPETQEQMRILNQDYFPIKFGSALYSKLRRRYWLENHVKGNPLIFAIHDYHQRDSMTWSNSAIGEYLYGYRYKPLFDANGTLCVVPIPIDHHEWQGKQIPSGFFFQPDAENVSAVLFSNSATISKYNRMGKLAGFGDKEIRMIRTGTAYNPDYNATEPIPFTFEVDHDKYQETWGQGLSMYHNPKANIPVSPDLFPKIAHHWLDEKNVQRSIFAGFHPFSSFTNVLVPKR